MTDARSEELRAKGWACYRAAERATERIVEEAFEEAAQWFFGRMPIEEQPRKGLTLGEEVRIGADRDLAGFEGRIVGFEDEADDGRIVHVELTGAARGIWRYKPEWLEPKRPEVV